MEQQHKICSENNVEAYPINPNHIIGVSDNFSDRGSVKHGLRHPPENGSCGWYLWSGDYSTSDDFFKPIHVSHIETKFPGLIKFLALPPGWRFLVADKHEDVWFDANLLDIEEN